MLLRQPKECYIGKTAGQRPWLRLAMAVGLCLCTSCGRHGADSEEEVVSLFVYDHAGVWSYDDHAHGVVRKPVTVDGDGFLDRLVADIHNAGAGFRLRLEIAPPGASTVKRLLVVRSGDHLEYTCEEWKMAVTFAPALECRFETPPAELYVSAAARF